MAYRRILVARVTLNIENLVPGSLRPLSAALVTRGCALERLGVIGRLLASPCGLEDHIDLSIPVTALEHREVLAEVTCLAVEAVRVVG